MKEQDKITIADMRLQGTEYEQEYVHEREAINLTPAERSAIRKAAFKTAAFYIAVSGCGFFLLMFLLNMWLT